MNTKKFTPLVLIVALLVSACGSLGAPAPAPTLDAAALRGTAAALETIDTQVKLACEVGNVEAVVIAGTPRPCPKKGALAASPQPAATSTPAGPTSAPAATVVAPGPVASPAAPTGSMVSLNYDETNSDPLTQGQKALVAAYLRLPAPISQATLEAAVAKIQQEAAAAKASVLECQTLTLDQKVAWLVWCSDATRVDPPADVSLVHEVSLLDPKTVGRTWIQVPFAAGVPLRSDASWAGCPAKFWAVRVH